jgi:hypothetical protein
MTPRSSIQGAFGLLLLAQTLTVQAQPATADEEAARPPPDTESAGLVSLLEFLGEFTTEDGEWVDPEILLETEVTGSGRRRELGAGNADDESANPVERCLDARCE